MPEREKAMTDERDRGEGKNIRVITTDDGSHSLFVPAINETYHSFHGAIQESSYVFIKMGLSYKINIDQKHPLRIFEVGFGTGLNALLTAEFAQTNQQKIQFTSIEAFPLSASVARKLNYTSFLDHPDATEWFKKIHDCSWGEACHVHDQFTLKKIMARLEEYSFEPESLDLIYFDAFAPNKQAELWDLKILESIVAAMASGAVFVTYSARGQLKRDLQSLHLKVNTLPGPPGKKEMVRAEKL